MLLFDLPAKRMRERRAKEISKQSGKAQRRYHADNRLD